MSMTPTEIALVLTAATGLLVAVGGGIRWLAEHRSTLSEANAELTKALAEATKTVKSQTETIATKNDEIREWRRRTERLEDRLADKDHRIDELEDRLYAGGGRR